MRPGPGMTLVRNRSEKLINIFSEKKTNPLGVYSVTGNFTNMNKMDTNNTKTRKNTLWIIQSVIPCGVGTFNTQRCKMRSGMHYF